MQRKRKLQADTDGGAPYSKRLRSRNYFDDLPPELIVLIFSFISHEQLWANLKLVCKKWKKLIPTPTLWKTIRADRNIPTRVLEKWLEHATLLQEIQLVDRNDADRIFHSLSKYSKNLKILYVDNCWGSTESITLRGKNLCKLAKNCKQLFDFQFSRVKIISRKFFKILSLRQYDDVNFTEMSKYSGPVNQKQFKTLMETIPLEEQPMILRIVDGEMSVSVPLDEEKFTNPDQIWQLILHPLGKIMNILHDSQDSDNGMMV